MRITFHWEENGKARQQTISNKKFVMGRENADIIIRDPYASRQHAKIIYLPERKCFFMYCLSSGNPIFIRDQRIIKGDAKIQLQEGLRFRLGKTVLTVGKIDTRQALGDTRNQVVCPKCGRLIDVVQFPDCPYDGTNLAFGKTRL